nr:hypothetical protein [Tanacetum cinerariifolium]
MRRRQGLPIPPVTSPVRQAASAFQAAVQSAVARGSELHEGLHLVLVGDVGREEADVRAGLPQLLFQHLAGLGVAIAQHQPGAIMREQASRGSADAAGGAGNRDDLVLNHVELFPVTRGSARHVDDDLADVVAAFEPPIGFGMFGKWVDLVRHRPDLAHRHRRKQGLEAGARTDADALDRHRPFEDVDRRQTATETADEADQADFPADAAGGDRLHDGGVACDLQDLVDPYPIGEGEDVVLPFR